MQRRASRDNFRCSHPESHDHRRDHFSDPRLRCVQLCNIAARESTPDIPVPYILVTTIYEGVSPEDVETSVTIKIEKELAGLKGVKEITSASGEGVSNITIEFLPDVEIDAAMQYVRDKVELAKGELPQEVEEPVLTEINMADFPIMMVNISGDISPVRLKMIADDLEDVIESLAGST